MTKFVEDKDHKNKEAILGALSSFLRAENFNSKREFVGKMGGLQFLAVLINNKEFSVRLHKKVLILMHDLIINDENIFEENPKQVRMTFGNEMGVLDRMMELFETASVDMQSNQYWDNREYILRNIFRIFQVCLDHHKTHQAYFLQHILKLQEAKKIAADDQKDLFDKEVELVLRVTNAPNLPIESNYKKENISPISQGDLKTAKAISMWL